MPVFETNLSGGLHTAKSTIQSPQASLRRAFGARYFQKSLSIAKAEGRQIVGSDLRAVGAGAHSRSAVRAIAGLSWDEGTTVAAGVPELRQLLYLTTDGELKTLPASDAAKDPEMNAANSRLLGYLATATNKLLPVAFENEIFLITNYGQTAITRKFGGVQQLLNHGVRTPATVGVEAFEADLSETVLPGFGGISIADEGIYWYWWTWFDPTTGLEGGAESENAQFVPITAAPITSEIWLLFNQGLALATPFAGAKIRIYKSFKISLPSEADSYADTNQWPIGYRIAELDPTVLDPLTAGNGNFEDIDSVRSGKMIYRDLTATEPDTVAIALNPVFDFVQVHIAGRKAQAALNSAPPILSSGAIFDDSLIGFKKSDPRKSVFSFPGKPHAFPGIFFVNHDSSEDDIGMAHVILNNACIAFLRYSVDVINWLPRESDEDFSRGRLKDTISPDRGLASPNGYAKFSHPRGGSMAAWVSDDGLYATNARSVIELSGNINWGELVSVPESCYLINDPGEKRLVLAHQSPGDDKPRSLTFFHYDEVHLDRGGLPAVIGPVPRPGGIEGLALVRKNGGRRQLVSTDEHGSIHYETLGKVDEHSISVEEAAGEAWTDEVLSQKLYLSGRTREFEVQRTFAYGEGAAGQVQLLDQDGTPVEEVDVSAGLAFSGKTQAVEAIQFRLSGLEHKVDAVGVNVMGEIGDVE